MASDDRKDFGDDRTVIRPNPGGRRPDPAGQPGPGGGPQQPAAPPPQQPMAPPPQQPMAPPPQQPMAPPPQQPMAPPPQQPMAGPGYGSAPVAPQGPPVTGMAAAGQNALLDSAIAPLALIHQLRTTAHHADVPALQRQLIQQIGEFEATARSRGASAEAINAARYCLCTALDEAVLSTPWGADSAWNTQSLLVTFHKETWGGEKLFRLLENLMQDPGSNLDLLEFIYFILSLGFEGKYRVMERGEGRLEELRMSVFERLRPFRGEFERELSPQWRGIGASGRRGIRQVPLWVIAAMVGAVVITSHTVMSFVLSQSSAPVHEKLEAINKVAKDGKDGRT